jgi:hypothetical protein
LSEVISAHLLRGIVIGLNLLHQKLLIDEGKKASADALAKRISTAVAIYEKHDRDEVCEESDFIDNAFDLLYGIGAKPKRKWFWDSPEFQYGLESVLWNVTLENFSPRTVRYHRQFFEKWTALLTAAKELVDVLDSAPDLESLFHGMVREGVKPLQDLSEVVKTGAAGVPEGRLNRDRETLAGYILAEKFFVQDCGLNKGSAYMVSAILLWYTGVLSGEALAEDAETPFGTAADRLSRRVRRLFSSDPTSGQNHPE